MNSPPPQNRTAAVIGAGPNGLAAAITLAQRKFSSRCLRKPNHKPGGAARTLELTEPGFLHDFGSAVHPLAAGSPIFLLPPTSISRLGMDTLAQHHLAHPFDDGTAITLERDLRESRIRPHTRRQSFGALLLEPFAETLADSRR